MTTKNLYIVIIKRSVRLLFSERVQIDLIVPRCYFGCVKMTMVCQIPDSSFFQGRTQNFGKGGGGGSG